MFGSVLREDFRPDSDIDFLVTWAPGVKRTVCDMFEMKDDLAALYHRTIGLAQRQVVERDFNPIRRRNILESARAVYAAA